MAQATYIQLPVETLSHIFSYLGFADQLTASLTCRLWQDVIFNTKFLRNRRYHPEGQQYDKIEYHDCVHRLFSKESSLILTINQDKLKHTIVVYNSQSITLGNSPILDEPMMLPLDINENLPLDEDEDDINELRKEEHCYCDRCMGVTCTDGRMELPVYYNVMFPDKDTPVSKYDSYGSKDRELTPHKTIREVVNSIVKKGVSVFRRHRGGHRDGRAAETFYMNIRFRYQL
ncbi:hypothetical protein TWF506_008942 [Arthrobotrys conoides]|uniref:F-box domain-containing protein n=1 Tax=Arthrobotrys conoides TaxID=74498 RepID=A0AAN8RWQ8_9PEZI